MVFPCKIRINQYAKIFYVCLLIEEDKLLSVNIKYLDHDITIKFLLIRMKDYKIRLFTGLPYGNPSLEMEGICSVLLLFFFFRVGKSLACHSPGKWYLCA